MDSAHRSSQRARFLINPSAARGRGAAHLPLLREVARRLDAPLHATTSGSDLRDQARRAVEEGVERLVVVGGDGTFHLVLQELAGTDCALVPVPAGRGNDLASCLGLDGRSRRLAERVTELPVERVDVGRAGAVTFGVHCGVGFDSEAARWANEQRLASGILGYPLSVLRTLWSFEPPRMSLEHAGGRFEGEAMLVVCANCWRFGGGMRIAPEASIRDGLLDVVLVRKVSRAMLLAIFPLVYFGRHVGHPAVDIVKSPWARIALDRRMRMYGDGEPMEWVSEEPLEVEVQPAALQVVA